MLPSCTSSSLSTKVERLIEVFSTELNNTKGTADFFPIMQFMQTDPIWIELRIQA